MAAHDVDEKLAARDLAGGRDVRRATQGNLALDDDLAEMKPRFPTGNELEETASIMRVLATAAAPLAVADIARTFAQGKAIERRVELTVSALARLGHLISADRGKTFTLRRT